MSRATSPMRNFAHRLVAYEASENIAAEPGIPAPFRVVQKLRLRLTALMGNAGVRGLLSRSLALSGEENRWMRAVHVQSDGSLTGLQELHAKVSPEDYMDGGVDLLAHLLGLLVTFIGESLTLLLVSEIWPSIGNPDADKGRLE